MKYTEETLQLARECLLNAENQLANEQKCIDKFAAKYSIPEAELQKVINCLHMAHFWRGSISYWGAIVRGLEGGNDGKPNR